LNIQTILRSQKTIWILFVLIMLLGAFLRFDFVNNVTQKDSHDTINYDVMVKQIIEKGIYAYKDEVSNAQVMPGFPLFLATIYKIVDYTARDPFPYVRNAQVLLSLVSLALIFLITRKLAGGWVGLAALTASAIYPPFVWANGAILTEVLALFFFLLYIFWQLRALETATWYDSLIAGAFLGCTGLVRAEFLPVIVPIYLFYWFWKKKRDFWKLLLIGCIGIGVVMSPWWIRNLVTMDKIILTATQTNPFTAGTYPNKNYEDGLVDRHGKTQDEVARERLRIGFTQHTWTFVKWYTIGKLDYTYSRMYFGSIHGSYNIIPKPDLYHKAIIWVGVLGLILTAIRWRQLMTPLAIIIVVMSLLRLLFVPEYRYNYLMMPLFIIIDSVVVCAGIKLLYGKLRGGASAAV